MEKTKYCSVCKSCSGCQLSNLSYLEQVKLKQAGLRRAFGSLIKPKRLIEASSPLNYRNKAQLVFKRHNGKIRFGIYQSSQKSIVITDNCPLHSQKANAIARTLCGLFEDFHLPPFDFKRKQGFVRSVVVREGFNSGEVLVNLVASKNTFSKEREFSAALAEKHPYIKSIIISESQSNKLTSGGNPRTLFGEAYIKDTLGSFEFKIGYNTFYQINPVQTEILYNTALKAAQLTASDTVLDAYCGIGTVSLFASKLCKKVIGVELNPDSIANAEINALANKVQNAEFYAGDVKKQIKLLLNRGVHFDACFVDPPRLGCDIDFLKSLVSAEIPKIVYISCNAETQVRDVRFLLKHGYKLISQQGVDMFPYTKHVETICLLSKKICCIY